MDEVDVDVDAFVAVVELAVVVPEMQDAVASEIRSGVTLRMWQQRRRRHEEEEQGTTGHEDAVADVDVGVVVGVNVDVVGDVVGDDDEEAVVGEMCKSNCMEEEQDDDEGEEEEEQHQLQSNQ